MPTRKKNKFGHPCCGNPNIVIHEQQGCNICTNCATLQDSVYAEQMWSPQAFMSVDEKFAETEEARAVKNKSLQKLKKELEKKQKKKTLSKKQRAKVNKEYEEQKEAGEQYMEFQRKQRAKTVDDALAELGLNFGKVRRDKKTGKSYIKKKIKSGKNAGKFRRVYLRGAKFGAESASSDWIEELEEENAALVENPTRPRRLQEMRNRRARQNEDEGAPARSRGEPQNEGAPARFGKIPKSLKNKAKSFGIRLTTGKVGNRKRKSEKTLRKQVKNAEKRK